MGYVRECVFRGRHVSKAFDDLEAYASEFINQKQLAIEPWELTKSLQFYLDNGPQDKKEKIEKALWDYEVVNNEIVNSNLGTSGRLIKLMTVTKDMALEIEFFEWLLMENKFFDIQKMPLVVFEEQVKGYLEQRFGVVDRKYFDDLVKFFKSDNSSTDNLFDKLRNSLSKKHYEKYVSLKELYDRYASSKIFKCFFLPLSNDKDFSLFIKNRWVDLNALSGDYLDIYYGVDELHSSGYQIAEKFKELDVPINALPCLVLWEKRVSKAQFIEIRKLCYESDVLHIIQTIVQNIKDNKGFDYICREAVKMADKARDSYNLGTKIEQNITITDSTIDNSSIGSVNQQVSGGDLLIDSVKLEVFVDEIKKAISQIEQLPDLSKEQKESLSKLLNDAKIAVEENDEKKKEVCKSSFEVFKTFAGKAAEKVLAILMKYGTIAAFFGIGK